MKEFEVTIKATAFKRAKVFAETEEAAINLANEIYCKTNLLDFKDEDVDEISVGADQLDTLQEVDITFSFSNCYINNGTEFHSPMDGRTASTNVISVDQ